MEAASARYAARDRFSSFGEPAQSALQRYIQNAVDPQNFEPNIALDLEIADLINSKKGNAPREAAISIVNFINHRNPNVGLLALQLLDICVKNCGYAFHLQISTKEFLNELVRRFPERPPVRPTRVQLKILEQIEEWRSTICQTSRYKEDLGFIRDMHRLLSYKGYTFPETRREDAAVLNPSEALKSAEEMEEEEREAQSAKLQELIRRGGPGDLQEANRLMKIMAGYDTKNKTDYRAVAAQEIGKIQAKARALEEKLQNFKKGDIIRDGDSFSEMAGALQSAQPKIQKMCEEESEDQEAVAKLFEINDSINRTIQRYKLIQKGDLEGAAKIPQGTLGTSTGVGRNAKNELSLIDFGGDDEPTSSNGNASSSQAKSATGFEDDLLGLSLQDNNATFGQGGGIALGFGANTNVPGPSLLSSTMQQSSAKVPTPSRTPQPQQPIPIKPNYDAFSAFSNSRTTLQSTTPAPSLLQQQQQRPTPQVQASSDPFGGLSLGSPPPQVMAPPAAQASSSSFDIFNTQAQKPIASATNGAATEDDWDFSSAVPEEIQPTAATLVVSDKDVKITFDISRRADDISVVDVLAKFSNKTPLPITEYTFSIAVSKSYTLKLTPQSGRKLQPVQVNGITQPIEIHGVGKGQAGQVKIRWRATYKAAGDVRQESGEVPPLTIA